MIITIDIVNKINIPNIAAFKDIAPIIGFEYTTSRIGEDNKSMKVLKENRGVSADSLTLGYDFLSL